MCTSAVLLLRFSGSPPVADLGREGSWFRGVAWGGGGGGVVSYPDPKLSSCGWITSPLYCIHYSRAESETLVYKVLLEQMRCFVYTDFRIA